MFFTPQEDLLPLVTIFGILIATTSASVGLLALWAGSSPWHWFLRTMIVLAALAPLLFVPAYEPFVALAVEAAIIASMAHIVLAFRQRKQADCGGELASEDAISNPPTMKRRRLPRYSVLSILLLMALFAIAAAIWTKLPAGTLKSWSNVVLIGVAGAVATLAGSWTARPSKTHWWKVRIHSIVIIGFLAGIIISLFFFDEALCSFENGWGWPPIDFTIPFPVTNPRHANAWFWIIGAIFCIVRIWLWLARKAGARFWHQNAIKPSARQISARVNFVFSSLTKVIFVLLTIATVSLPFYVCFRLLTPTPIPPINLPKPNGYDDLIAAGKMMEASTIFPDWDVTAEDLLAKETAQYSVAYDRLRLGLDRECMVPVKFNVDADLDGMLHIRTLARALVTAGRVAEWDGSLDDSIKSYLDCIKLGVKSARGGLFIHSITGWTVEGIGHSQLAGIRRQLSTKQCHHMIDQLEQYEKLREPESEVIHRERIWQQHAQGWFGRLFFIIEDLSGWKDPTLKGMREINLRRQTITRLLMADLAIRAHQLERGTLPYSLTELVPEYLSEVPRDPFGHGPLVYRQSGDGFLLYSYGLDHDDDAGEPPHRDPSGDYDWYGFNSHMQGDLSLDTWFED